MERPAVRPQSIAHLRLKVAALLVILPLGILALTGYALQARGAFEGSRIVRLSASNVDGVDIGMPVNYSGFPIGSVRTMGLSEGGQAWVDVAVLDRNMRWLRQSSTFTLVRPVVGGAKIRVETPRLSDPALPEGASPVLLLDDAAREIPEVMAQAKSVLDNLDRLTAADSSLGRSLARLDVMAGRMTGPYGALEGLTGSPQSSRRIISSIDRLHELTVSMNLLAQKMDRVLDQAAEAAGDRGIAGDARRTLAAASESLAELRPAIRKLDEALENARSASADLVVIAKTGRSATTDLDTLRAQVDDSLEKTRSLLNDLNRKWPFAREAELRLP